jgi:hypothetical protein
MNLSTVIRINEASTYKQILDRIIPLSDEIIVGNNFKDPDESRDLITFCSRYPNIKVVDWTQVEVLKVGDSRNIELENKKQTLAYFQQYMFDQATLPWILKLDDDTLLDPDSLNKIANILEQDQPIERVIRLFYLDVLERSSEYFIPVMISHNPSILGGHYNDHFLIQKSYYQLHRELGLGWVMPKWPIPYAARVSQYLGNWNQEYYGERFLFLDETEYENLFAGLHLKYTKPVKTWYKNSLSTLRKQHENDFYFKLNKDVLNYKINCKGLHRKYRDKSELPSGWFTYPRRGSEGVKVRDAVIRLPALDD